MILARFLRAQPRWLLLLEATVLVMGIGGLDIASGWELSLFVLYALPILLVVWFGDRPSGIFFAVFSSVVWWWANEATHPYETQWGFATATATRFFYFVFVAVGGAALREQNDAARARIAALERTRDLEHQIVRASEREQQRIGQDLHDGLCQYLAAIGCAARSLSDDLRARSAPEADAATEIETLLRGAVVEARDLARGIFPVQMDDGGLAPALEELAAKATQLMPVVATFEDIGETRIADPEVGMHLYRIAQEALRNAVLHGRAGHVIIRLESGATGITLTVLDDGEGFASDALQSPGMGLKTMQYRARTIGAALDIEMRPEGGALVRCALSAGSATPPKLLHANAA